jgi:hypothetical protein
LVPLESSAAEATAVVTATAAGKPAISEMISPREMRSDKMNPPGGRGGLALLRIMRPPSQ